MGLSESEIEARLAALRRRREALDREIADLVLYLELGRRLGAAGSDARQDPAPVSARPPVPASDPAGDLADAPAGRERGVPQVRSEPLRAPRRAAWGGRTPSGGACRIPAQQYVICEPVSVAAKDVLLRLKLRHDNGDLGVFAWQLFSRE